MGNANEKMTKILSRKDVIALAFGAMIGWGWVVLSGDWITQAGTLGGMVAFLIGGLMVTFVGLTYAELVAAMPKVGGEHYYTLRALGPKASFIASWAIAMGYLTVVGIEAVAFPSVLDYLFPGYGQGYLWTVAGSEVTITWVLVGVLGSIVITALNYFGIQPAAVFQTICTLFIIVVGLLLFIGAPIGGSTENFHPFFVNGFGGVMSVIVMVPFLFVGFDVIPQAAEEMNVPSKKIGSLLLISVTLAVVYYMAIVVGVGMGLDQAALKQSDLAAADAIAAIFGTPLMGNVLVLAGVAGILTSWNAFLIGGSRVLYAMAESGMLPAWLGQLHPKYHTPSNAILLLGGLSCIAPFFGEEMLTWLVNAGGLNIVVSYFLVAVSFLFLRKKEPNMKRPFRAGKGPVVGYLAILLSLFIAVQYMPGMEASLNWQEWLINLLWWVAGVLFLLRMNVSESYLAEVKTHME